MLSPSSPLAAETHPSATRSLDSATVLPGGTVTVTVDVTVPQPATGNAFSRLTETLPDGFQYVDGSATLQLVDPSEAAQGVLSFNLLGTSASVTYQATASSTEDTYVFAGTLTIREGDAAGDYTVGGDTSLTVSTDTGPPPVDTGELQFDVVPVKAVKGAVVSGLNHPIGSNPLEWDVSDVATGTLVSIANDGIVGDFQVKDAGSGIFRLEVMTSGAPSLSGSQSINVALSYDDDTTVNLTGDITEQMLLTFTNSPFDFTISNRP